MELWLIKIILAGTMFLLTITAGIGPLKVSCAAAFYIIFSLLLLVIKTFAS